MGLHRLPSRTVTRSADRPPVIRFLVLFAGLLAVALGLAAVSDAAQSPAERDAAAAASSQRAAAPAQPR
jgi:TctA family transporter